MPKSNSKKVTEGTSYLEGADTSAPLKNNSNEASSILGQMTSKADSAIQNLSELKEILSVQKKGDASILEEIIEKTKQLKNSLIKELNDSIQSKSIEMAAESVADIHKGQKYKNLSGSVTEIIEKFYK